MGTVSSERQIKTSTVALARPRDEYPSEDSADVIDLVHLPRGTRPTPIASVHFEEVERLRVLECEDYQGCLTFVSEVKWRSFHCRQCPKNPDRIGAQSAQEEVRAAGQNASVIKLR